MKTITIRFWEKVNKQNNCWVWKASCNKQGYGIFNYQGRRMRAHRFSWYLTNGYFSKKDILHKCDNPPCVKPAHLFEGDDKDNVRDAIKKGRFFNSFENLRRTRERQRKLTNEQANEIRNKYKKYIYTYKMLMKEYGIETTAIQRILKRETYK